MNENSGLAVAVSGSGTILEFMIYKKLPISYVFADRECRGIQLAKTEGISTKVFARSFKREVFTEEERHRYTLEIVRELHAHQINLLAMAGFMTILAPVFFTTFLGRITNIHPSLLPAFKGEKAVADALAFGVKVTGTTIHIATEKLDEGPILAQEAVEVKPLDTVDSLWERIKIVERRLYPEVIAQLLQVPN